VALYDALGRPILPFVAVLIALVATTFAPFLASVPGLRRSLNASIAAAAIACIVMAVLIPTYEAGSPRHINIEYIDDGTASRWQTDWLRPDMLKVAHFSQTPQQTYDWTVPPSPPRRRSAWRPRNCAWCMTIAIAAAT
jgi:hypothetical protein